MISFFRNLFSGKNGRKELQITVMLIGLDNAGKTTLLSTIQGETDHHVMPTIGFNREQVKHGRYDITYFDLGGSEKIRGIWSHYFASIHGAIFVVDSADKNRFEEAKQALFDSVKHPQFRGKSLLILANKQDKKEAIPAHEIAQLLDLDQLQDHVYRYNILPCAALSQPNKPTDPQIKKGLSWLGDAIDEDFEKLSKRVDKESKEAEEKERLAYESKKRQIQQRKEKEEQALKEQDVNSPTAQ
jgi:ADP-ribosylation factor-like protein 13B